MGEMASLRGQLLVATPVIGDGNFDRTVVLLLEHHDEGALGLVLNRPTEVDVVDPLPEWNGLAAQPSVVFVGGPVEQNAAIGLARATSPVPADGWSPVLDDIGTFDLSQNPTELTVTGIEQVRVYAGYAGWSAGQLEAEMAADAWIVVDARPDDVLCDDPLLLWSRVLRRQGGDLALLSYCPPDPSSN